MNTWVEVTALLRDAPPDWAPWVEIFRSHGVEGTRQDEAPPALTGYVSARTPARLARLCDALERAGASKVLEREIPEADWAEAWKEFFQPRRIGRFYVRPSWRDDATPNGDLEIVLDPGQAFGTGDHATTRMCLALVEDALKPGDRLADVGVGSGILSIAAAKLGGRVTAVEIDPPAVAAARENVARNGVDVEVLEGDGFEPLLSGEPFDVVVSNLISALLVRLAPAAAAVLRPGGAWIVSGIIEANWGDVLGAAQGVGFHLESEHREDDWHAALFRR